MTSIWEVARSGTEAVTSHPQQSSANCVDWAAPKFGAGSSCFRFSRESCTSLAGPRSLAGALHQGDPAGTMMTLWLE
jgi:hypothetical protein